MSEKKNKNKTLAKEIALVVLLWGSILFIVIGGTMWRNDRFDGTLMEVLFPALFWGYVSGFFALVILTVVSYLFEITPTLYVMILVPMALLLLLGLINWITERR